MINGLFNKTSETKKERKKRFLHKLPIKCVFHLDFRTEYCNVLKNKNQYFQN